MLVRQARRMATPPTWMLLFPPAGLLRQLVLPLALIDCRPSLAAQPPAAGPLVLGRPSPPLPRAEPSRTATGPRSCWRTIFAWLATAGLAGFEAQRPADTVDRPAGLGAGRPQARCPARAPGAWGGAGQAFGWRCMLAVLTGALPVGAASLGGLLGPREPFPFGPSWPSAHRHLGGRAKAGAEPAPDPSGRRQPLMDSFASSLLIAQSLFDSFAIDARPSGSSVPPRSGEGDAPF